MVLSRRRLLASSLGATSALPALRAQAEDTLPAFRFDEHLLVPVRAHLLRATTASELNSSLLAAQVPPIFAKINAKIWSQAGIQLILESVVEETAPNQETYAKLGDSWVGRDLLDIRPEASLAAGMLHVYYIRRFHPKARANGLFLPRAGISTAIFVADTSRFPTLIQGGIDEPVAKVTGHEIGHALSLEHLKDGDNLMQGGHNGCILNQEQVTRTRAVATKLRNALSVKETWTAVDLAVTDKKWERARALLTCLAGIPVASPERRRAREQLTTLPKVAAG